MDVCSRCACERSLKNMVAWDWEWDVDPPDFPDLFGAGSGKFTPCFALAFRPRRDYSQKRPFAEKAVKLYAGNCGLVEGVQDDAAGCVRKIVEGGG